MRHTMLWTVAAAALLSPTANTPAAGQTYNPYISTAAVGRSKKTARKGKSATYPRMGQPPAGTSSSAKKKPPPEFDYDDDDLPAGNKEKRRPRLRSR